MLTSEKAYPNLHRELVQRHMDNGLRKCIGQAVERKTSVQQNRSLRKGVYTISWLLGNRRRSEEVFNGFKDEFTDFTKYKRKGMGMGFRCRIQKGALDMELCALQGAFLWVGREELVC